MIVHLQTTISTVFGIVDDEGNVAPQQPIVAQVGCFDPVVFTEAFDAIKACRDEIASADEKPSPGVPPTAF